MAVPFYFSDLDAAAPSLSSKVGDLNEAGVIKSKSSFPPHCQFEFQFPFA